MRKILYHIYERRIFFCIFMMGVFFSLFVQFLFMFFSGHTLSCGNMGLIAYHHEVAFYVADGKDEYALFYKHSPLVWSHSEKDENVQLAYCVPKEVQTLCMLDWNKTTKKSSSVYFCLPVQGKRNYVYHDDDGDGFFETIDHFGGNKVTRYSVTKRNDEITISNVKSYENLPE